MMKGVFCGQMIKKSPKITKIVTQKVTFWGDFHQKMTFCKKQAGLRRFSLKRIEFLALPPFVLPNIDGQPRFSAPAPLKARCGFAMEGMMRPQIVLKDLFNGVLIPGLLWLNTIRRIVLLFIWDEACPIAGEGRYCKAKQFRR